MIAHYVYDQLNIKKMKVHFNEFMIAFHDFKHKRKDGYSITQFVQNLKKCDFIFLMNFRLRI